MGNVLVRFTSVVNTSIVFVSIFPLYISRKTRRLIFYTDMCTGNYSGSGRPPFNSKCSKSCVYQKGEWGSSWCYVEGGKWGAPCIPCGGMQ